jgi:hypothetical protein
MCGVWLGRCRPTSTARATWQDWITGHTHAVAAAVRLEDRLVEAVARRSLARALRQVGRHVDAENELVLAEKLCDDSDPYPAALVQSSFSLLRESQGRVRDALGHALRAIDLYRHAGSRIGEANAL